MKNIIRYVLSLLFICSFGQMIFGQSISKEEAISKAKQFINTTFPQSRAGDDAQFEQVDIAKYLYVFNLSTGGYVIVSGEPTTESIIGYSTSRKIDKNNLPPNLKAVLNGYENEIKSSIGTKEPLSRADATPHYYKAIEPLVKVKWNQGSPYDKYTPYVNGQKTPTGCVPTAMAQLMGYYKWPKKGHGCLTYWFNEFDKNKADTIIGESMYRIDSINLDTTPIDWTNICNTYRGSETEAQKDAVAMLMKMCGYACGVSYYPSGSGANGRAPKGALEIHFYYKAKYIADWGDYQYKWNSMYEALKEKKPLICEIGGIGNNGHEVIVDGCDKNGFFHINFGWGGSYDGYFRMCDEKHVGYTFGLFTAVILAEPDYEMNGDNEEYSTGYITIRNYDGTYNYSEENGEEDYFDVGLLGKNVDGGIRIAVSETENKYVKLLENDEEGRATSMENIVLGGGTKVSYMVELTSKLGLANGRYKCYPAYKKKGENKWIDYKIESPESPSYILMIVSDSGIVFTNPDISNATIKVDDQTICIDGYCLVANINVFNTYGLLVYSGKDDKIKVNSPGVYTIRIGCKDSFLKKEKSEFIKSVIVK